MKTTLSILSSEKKQELYDALSGTENVSQANRVLQKYGVSARAKTSESFKVLRDYIKTRIAFDNFKPGLAGIQQTKGDNKLTKLPTEELLALKRRLALSRTLAEANRAMAHHGLDAEGKPPIANKATLNIYRSYLSDLVGGSAPTIIGDRVVVDSGAGQFYVYDTKTREALTLELPEHVSMKLHTLSYQGNKMAVSTGGLVNAIFQKEPKNAWTPPNGETIFDVKVNGKEKFTTDGDALIRVETVSGKIYQITLDDIKG